MMSTKKSESIRGLVIATAIIGLWLGSLIYFLSLNLTSEKIAWIPVAVLWQTFLHTGLFITAHDAMHGTVFPANRKVNNAVGMLSVILYALFSYRKLLAKHWEHHRHPAGADDPDFHDGQHTGFFAWYFHFLKNYISWKQIMGMAIVFNLLEHGLNVPAINLAVLWVTPALLSTLQLFYFGTYLPHREDEKGYADRHHARSNAYPVWLSFLTCYHFGYHWEHHEFPRVPWWKLHRTRKTVLETQNFGK